MPIDVDSREAPALLRLRCYDPYPTAEEITAVRGRLIDAGLLNEDSVSLIDLRDLSAIDDEAIFQQLVQALVSHGEYPRRRAILINPGVHLKRLQQFQQMAPKSMTAAGFLDEQQAIEWLLNPEGTTGFRK